MKMRSLRVLFDQRVIPNYRVPIFARIGRAPDIDLIVSYWTERLPTDPPHVHAAQDFGTVAFHPWRFRFGGKEQFFNIDLLKYVLRTRPDVVIGPDGLFGIHVVFSFVLERLCHWAVGTEFIYRTSGSTFPDAKLVVAPKGLKKLWHRIRAQYTFSLVYGERAAEQLRTLGYPEARIHVDYNAMDSELLFAIRDRLEATEREWREDFSRSLGISGKDVILFVGRIYPEKRVDLLIKAFKHIVKECSDVVLVVVGSGPGREDAIRQARHLGQRVHFVEGVYDDEELARYYTIADLVVFPGYATLSLYFALCFGKAIITSLYGNEVEYVTDGVNGLLYRYGDGQDLADKIKLLLQNPNLRRRYGEAGEQLVRDKIGVEHMVGTIVNTVYDLMGR